MMQHPSPALSSPSTGFLGARASPLFTPSIDQIEPPLLPPTSDLPPRPPQPPIDPSSPLPDHEQAPPTQLAQAMEGLGQAIRLISDVRLGADLLLEALERATVHRGGGSEASSKKASEWVVAAAEAMRQSLEALRTTGRKLEASGVLNGAQQQFEEKQPWGLQAPLVCPDGAIVPYSWKRQIAGQAAASAVDRTRLALKAFTEQKKRFFPRLGDSLEDYGDAISCTTSGKKYRLSVDNGKNGFEQDFHDQLSDSSSLSDLLQRCQMENLGMVITPFTRMEWAKHQYTSSTQKGSMTGGNSVLGQPTSHIKTVKQEPGMAMAVNLVDGQESSASGVAFTNKVAILEVIVPAVFKAVVSLLPAGSMDPEGVSFFSLDEAGSHVQAGGLSVHNVFRQITEYGTTVLHKFLRSSRSSALTLLLHWIYSYQSLFTKPCSQCKRILVLDHPSDLLLPPLVRPYHPVLKASVSGAFVKTEELNEDKSLAYHLACLPKEEMHSF